MGRGFFEVSSCHCERPTGAWQSHRIFTERLLRRSAPRNDTGERDFRGNDNVASHDAKGVRESGRWCARADLNCRPFAPQANALSGLSYGRDAGLRENRRDYNMMAMSGQAAPGSHPGPEIVVEPSLLARRTAPRLLDVYRAPP